MLLRVTSKIKDFFSTVLILLSGERQFRMKYWNWNFKIRFPEKGFILGATQNSICVSNIKQFGYEKTGPLSSCSKAFP